MSLLAAFVLFTLIYRTLTTTPPISAPRIRAGPPAK